MGRVSAGGELKRRDGFSAKINEIAIGSVRAQYSYFSHPLEIDFKGAGSFCYLLKLGGSMRVMSGGVDIELQVGESVIVPAFCDYAVAVGDQSSFLIFKFDEKALFTRSKMIGRPESSEDVLMLPTHERLGENGRSRTDTVAMALARQFSDKNPPSPVVAQGLANALVCSFLIESATQYPHLLKPYSPQIAQRVADPVESYIRMNLARDLTVDRLAKIGSMSRRSVFARFKLRYGMSPKVYIRNARLDQARYLLSSSSRGVSVIDIAFRCGFSSLGHFARRYSEKFGELPSATLSRRQETPIAEDHDARANRYAY